MRTILHRMQAALTQVRQVADLRRKPLNRHPSRKERNRTASDGAEERRPWRRHSQPLTTSPARGRLRPVVLGLAQDTRHALRALAGRPGLTATTVASLALAIGANIAIFGVVDRVLFRPLHVPHVDELITFEGAFQFRGSTTLRTWMHWHAATQLARLKTLRQVAVASVPSVPSARTKTSVHLSLDDSDTFSLNHVRAEFVSANYFRVLGVRPSLGRDFSDSDDHLSAAPVAILSHALWRTRFHSSTSVVGQTIRVNGTATVVVGVASPAYTGTSLRYPPPELILPLLTAARLATDTGTHTDGQNHFVIGNRPGFIRSPVSPVSEFVVVARIDPTTLHEVQAEVAALAGADHLVSYPGGASSWFVRPLIETMLTVDGRGDLRRFLTLLQCAVGLTLLIGCANLASVVVSRSKERRSTLAIRAALGAAPRRLVQLVALESALLAAAGGTAALLVAGWLTRGLSAYVLPGGVAIDGLRSGIDVRLMAFSAAVIATAAVLMGVASVAGVAGHNLAVEAALGSRAATRLGLSKLLVAVQVGICTVLVFLAALFVRSTSNALGTDLGFERRNLVAATLALPTGRPPDLTESSDVAHRVVAAAKRIPGVLSATVGPLPLSQGSDARRNDLVVDGRPLALSTAIDSVYARPDYFATLGLPVIHGRGFNEGDAFGTPLVAIVNEAAARRFWPDNDVLGRRIGFPLATGVPVPDFEIVGVVRDVKIRVLDEVPQPVIYLPRAQHFYFLQGMASGGAGLQLILRTDGVAGRLASDLVPMAAAAGLSVESITTLEDRLAHLLMPQRLGRQLLALLGITALIVTLVGIYGFVSRIVSIRSKEIGIRMALGAARRHIILSTCWDVVAPVVMGVTFGCVAALLGGHLVDRFMYGLSGVDRSTLCFTVGLLVSAGAAAALLPTLRATRIEPIEVLRED